MDQLVLPTLRLRSASPLTWWISGHGDKSVTRMLVNVLLPSTPLHALSLSLLLVNLLIQVFVVQHARFSNKCIDFFRQPRFVNNLAVLGLA